MPRRTVLLAVAIALSVATVNAQLNGSRVWQDLDLHCEEVSSLHVHPTDPNVVYALAINRGIYRSTDGGLSWNAVWVGEHTSNTVSLTISPSNPDHIVVTAFQYPNTGLLYHSTDGARPLNW